MSRNTSKSFVFRPRVAKTLVCLTCGDEPCEYRIGKKFGRFDRVGMDCRAMILYVEENEEERADGEGEFEE